ncbi:uncharacterized phosphotransferase YvkC [Caerostris extrusa]|uniref:Uncharacterized phosphotransferase YvkC n=1 Tax=Caerostris extrusa TaxID=172846 RepID=A0AAV4MM89_CAEEX|nr:uncharacterized phosphotransferase YvkC [Caerostris extrusa]
MIVSFVATLFNAPLEFIYWIKWYIAKTVIRIYNACHQSRFDLYDINAVGDPVKLGFVVPQVEKDLESPCPEQHLQEGVDEVVFYGTNSKSECLLIRIARGCNRISDAWIYLKLDNGKTYYLSKTAEYQQSFYGNSEIFSCDKLQMHYLSPMRKWRLFFCGMLKEISENGQESGDSLFVKFVFLWKASSDVYDCTLDTNPEGFADSLAKSKWKGSIIPPLKELMDALNFYAQSGTITGTVSVNDGSDHELYLYGEKIRYLGKKTSISGCRFTTALGNIPLKGLNFHLSDVSVPYIFDNIQLGYIVDADGAMKYLKELDLSMEPITAENEQRSFKANFSAGEQFEVTGSMSEPLRLNSSQGWVGSVELSFVEIEVGNKKGEISMEPELTKSVLSASLPEFVPLTVLFTDELSYFQEISGGKGSSLGKLTQLSHEKKSFIVPKGLIVTTSAYSEFLTPDILDAIKYLENIAYGNEEGDLKQACSKVSNIVEEAVLPKTICHSIFDGLKEIFRDKVTKHKFAVRSSATGEDTESMSAAGQMDTFLGVQGLTEIFAAVKKCWASQFGYIAVEYKRRNGQVLNSPMAVVIQDMVASEVSGVMFTCDPVTNNPSVITITANYGLGETVVSGSVEPDTFVLRRSDGDHVEVESVIIGSKLQNQKSCKVDLLILFEVH